MNRLFQISWGLMLGLWMPDALAQLSHQRSVTAGLQENTAVTALELGSESKVYTTALAELNFAELDVDKVSPWVQIDAVSYSNLSNLIEENCVDSSYCEAVASSITQSADSGSRRIQLPHVITLKSVLDTSGLELNGIKMAESRINDDEFVEITGEQFPSEEPYVGFTSVKSIASLERASHVHSVRVTSLDDLVSPELRLVFAKFGNTLEGEYNPPVVTEYKGEMDSESSTWSTLESPSTYVMMDDEVSLQGLGAGGHTYLISSKDEKENVAAIRYLMPVFPVFNPELSSISEVEAFANVDPGLSDATSLADLGSSNYGEQLSPLTLLNTRNKIGMRAIDSNGAITTVYLGHNEADTDGDGYIDAIDVLPDNGNEWLDFDGDNLGDNSDPDVDGDGVNNDVDAFVMDPTESLDTDGDGLGNNTDTDDDGDGLSDEYESQHNLDPLTSNIAVDTDGDGVDDLTEFALELNPQVADTDGDGLSDGDEIAVGLNPAVEDIAQIEHQTIIPNLRTARLLPSGTGVLSWGYAVSDDVLELSGLTLRLHYDSRVLTWLENEVPFEAGFVSRGSFNDHQDLDNDESTNRYIEYVWQSDEEKWPEVLPDNLLTAQVTLTGELDDFAYTSINITGGHVPQRIVDGNVIRYSVEGESIRIGLGEANFSLDVTGDGEIDPFSDGMIINRFLMGYPAESIALDEELSGATRSREEIYQLLQAAMELQ